MLQGVPSLVISRSIVLRISNSTLLGPNADVAIRLCVRSITSCYLLQDLEACSSMSPVCQFQGIYSRSSAHCQREFECRTTVCPYEYLLSLCCRTSPVVLLAFQISMNLVIKPRDTEESNSSRPVYTYQGEVESARIGSRSLHISHEA